MKNIAFIVLLVTGCGSKQQPASNTGGNEPTGPVKDTRTELEKRRDTACEALQPRLTECAIEDAKTSLSKEEYAKLKPEELREAHKKKWLDECGGSSFSSRQVRVLEVCLKEEQECDPLAECLKNLQPQDK